MIRIKPAPLIAVIGSSSPPSKALLDAYEVGKELAIRGAIVLCGGLGGVMESVSRGVYEAGGTTVGILPGNDPTQANSFIDIPIATGMGSARNAIITRAAQAVIAISGAFGTLSEIGHALADGTTVVGLDTWTFSTMGREDTTLIRATTPKEAVEMALEAAQQHRPMQ